MGSPFFLNKAKKKADKLSEKTDKRYRVFFLKNRYQVLTRSDIQSRKHSKEWGWHVNSTNMQPHAFYDTKQVSISNYPVFKEKGGTQTCHT
jgi:hypothetical protein